MQYRGDHVGAAADTEQRPSQARVQGSSPPSHALPPRWKSVGFWGLKDTQPDAGAGLTWPISDPARRQTAPSSAQGALWGLPGAGGSESVWEKLPTRSEGAGSTHSLSLPKELLVEEEDEKVDVDLGLVEELHDGHALVLELQEVLGGQPRGRERSWRALPCAHGPAVGHRTPRPASQARTPRVEDRGLTNVRSGRASARGPFSQSKGKSKKMWV